MASEMALQTAGEERINDIARRPSKCTEQERINSTARRPSKCSACGSIDSDAATALPTASACWESEGADTFLDAASQSRNPGSKASTGAADVVRSPKREVDEEAVIIFDWDDTLMPAFHIVYHCREVSPTPESPLWEEPLQQHARTVATTLRAARALGRVAIVTLSERGWIQHSTASFMPGLDFPLLLEELDISIYHALDYAPTSIASLARSPSATRRMLREGLDVMERCKRAAIEKCLHSICHRRQQLQLNVVSVGDSVIEQNALKAVLWSASASRLPPGAHLCKTVKFVELPSLDLLGEELNLLVAALPEMVAQREDFDCKALLN